MSDELDMTADSAAEPGRVPDRRLLLVAGTAVAGLVLGGAAFLFLGGGGEEPADEVVFAVPRRAVTTVGAASPTPTPSPSATATRETPENPFLARVTGGDGGAQSPATDPPVAADPLAADPLAGDPPADDPTAPGSVPVPTTPAPGLPTSVPALPTSTPSRPAPTVDLPTAAPTATRSAEPTAPAPARHTLVLTRVTGTAPALEGRFLVDGEVVPVAVGSSFGPGGLVVLHDLTQDQDGWVAVLSIGDGDRQDQRLGRVLTFS